MSEHNTRAPRSIFQTFLDLPYVANVADVDAEIAIIGMPYGDPYSVDELVNDQTNAPTALRRASMRLCQSLDRYDFDIGGTVFDGRPIRMVDMGDIAADLQDIHHHYRFAEQTIRALVAKGVLPISIGGDHGIPIPILRGLDQMGPVTIIHLDAHLDWRDEVNDVREGFSSTIRRASEMAHIGQIFQLGIRGSGSARPEEVEDALAHGAQIITHAEWEDAGTAAILERIPDNGNYYITIDADGFDPSVMPAVALPQPGGIKYREAIDLIKGIVAKGRVIGMDIVEITPERDVNEISSITAGHIILNLIGAAVRANYFER
ncbi:MAG: agmatinase [Castellaniella sp.]